MSNAAISWGHYLRTHLIGTQDTSSVGCSGDISQKQVGSCHLQSRADASEPTPHEKLLKIASQSTTHHAFTLYMSQSCLMHLMAQLNMSGVKMRLASYQFWSISVASVHLEWLPTAVIAGPHTRRGFLPCLSPSIPAGTLVTNLAKAYTEMVVPTAAAPTPNPCLESRGLERLDCAFERLYLFNFAASPTVRELFLLCLYVGLHSNGASITSITRIIDLSLPKACGSASACKTQRKFKLHGNNLHLGRQWGVPMPKIWCCLD